VHYGCGDMQDQVYVDQAVTRLKVTLRSNLIGKNYLLTGAIGPRVKPSGVFTGAGVAAAQSELIKTK
jgi:hypothetical protein